MRILLITDNHTPTGGAEHSFFELKRQLKNLPNLAVHSIGFGPHAEQGDDYHIFPAIRSTLRKLIWRTLLHPRLYFQLRKAIRHFAPDVIHLHNIKHYPITLLKAVRGYTVVQTVHDFGLLCPSGLNLHRDGHPCPTGMRPHCCWEHQVKYNRVAYLALLPSWWRINRLLKQTVHTFMAPSPLLTDYLNKAKFYPATCVLPFNPAKHPQPYTLAKPGHFLFAGQLGMHKGVHLLLEEFAFACAQQAGLSLTLAGTGPEETTLKQTAKRLGIEDRVHFAGWQTDLNPYYAAAAAVIFPSIGLESFGLVITEAMACARPVIGVNRGTSAWLIKDNETGLLFDPLHPGDLAEKMLTLANAPERAEALGQNGATAIQAMKKNTEILDEIIGVYRNRNAVRHE